MSVVLIAVTLWIALSVVVALILARAVRVAEQRELGGADPLSSGPSLGDAPSEVVDPTVDSSRESSRQQS